MENRGKIDRVVAGAHWEWLGLAAIGLGVVLGAGGEAVKQLLTQEKLETFSIFASGVTGLFVIGVPLALGCVVADAWKFRIIGRPVDRNGVDMNEGWGSGEDKL
ncbi:MAG: hypothetical protein UX87_C0032G0004 [Candidatus Amesbacteria bacterium GW2011_GWA1_47_16]|uniref:Uncharacterized protein n=3 Tax=Candidatus Amesiibacteriota TaxID=1752730 RepID=A0A1F4ZUR5_9BACT|nr:MAG: hypothetical protein UX87_C0032G0004 [Candidatus Amesbacteria bacterium GW2011_GWA1_47_16]OGC97889.1 MAG: hypothetical protein A2701_03135 [Candidatus Amesbacteria bacterium RIFCSPHIGHO2_01_FULL_47_34]OGD01395.1 MAG: hypothetical protein A2972_04180 [Candidatus Amesbacteria bacterium RIFCSPLOWO2_01_FULL_47_33]OGD10105.1 MAG: hypothetical protein A2395_04085 [Candidatus Amesbacteria bacterium RIFOXYB1_FULL_47_9]